LIHIMIRWRRNSSEKWKKKISRWEKLNPVRCLKDIWRCEQIFGKAQNRKTRHDGSDVTQSKWVRTFLN
jgi:hypothetical protein